MEDTTRGGSTFIDEPNDFDLLIEDEADGNVGAKRILRPRRRDAYRPLRLGRTTPNWSRIAAALLVLAVFLFVVGFAIDSYLDHRRVVAFETYFSQVEDATGQSAIQGKELSNLLSQPTTDRAQLVGRLDKLSRRADETVAFARAIQPPDQMLTNHQWLVTTLEYRRNGLEGLHKAMTGALAAARDPKAPAAAVAAANERLVASDVIYQDSYLPLARSVLTSEDVDGVRVPESEFVTDPEFASTKAMTLMLERLTAGVTAARGKKVRFKDGKVRGGQLGQVVMSPSGQALSTTSTTEVEGSDNLAFEVSFENQGEVQATQVPVVITIKGQTSEPTEIRAVIDRVDPGQVGSVRVPLDTTPPFGETLTVVVQAGPVPGERNANNNAATFNLLFRL